MSRGWAWTVVCALVLAGCGDDPLPVQQVGPQASPTEPLPAAAWLDDLGVVDRVYEAAAAPSPVALAVLELPPRVSRVRVAVTALHDHLLQRREPAPGLPALMNALRALDRASGGADESALGPLVEAWSKWTVEQADAERELARRATFLTATLTTRQPLDREKLAEILRAAPQAPPMSPGAAIVSVADAALALPEGDGASSGEKLTAAVGAARARFQVLGWPGGLASLLDPLAARRMSGRSKDPLGLELTSSAIDGYQASGDEVRVAEIYVDRARMLVNPGASTLDSGDLARAHQMARIAVRRLDKVGARGRELAEALSMQGTLAQMKGDHGSAVDVLERAMKEVSWARLDPELEVGVRRVAAVSLARLGRFEDATTAARRGAELFDTAVRQETSELASVRAELDETAALAAAELGRFTEAARLLGEAAERYADLGREDASDFASIHRASATARGGDPAAALDVLGPLLAREDLSPSNRVLAIQFLLDMGELGRAETQLRRSGDSVGPAVALLHARLHGARGNLGEARRLFQLVERQFGQGDPSGGGYPAARVLLLWADAEEAAGEVGSAAALCSKATYILGLAALPVELDRARERLVALHRLRNRRDQAVSPAVGRVNARLPRSDQERAALLEDLLLLQVEAVLQNPRRRRARAALTATLERLAETPEGPCVARCVTGIIDGKGAAADFAPPPGASRRVVLMSEVAQAAVDPQPVGELAQGMTRVALDAAAAGEGEICRWAALVALRAVRQDVNAVDPATVLDLIELRRRGKTADLDALRSGWPEGSGLVVLENCGGFWVRATLTSVTVFDDSALLAPPASGPSPSDVATRSSAFWRGVLGPRGPGAARLVLSVSASAEFLPIDFFTVTQAGGDVPLLQSAGVSFVGSLAEAVDCLGRPVPETVPLLELPDDALRTRYAVVAMIPVTPSDRDDFMKLFADEYRGTRDAAVALRNAKKRFRADRGGPSPNPAVPAWAAFQLRGVQ